MLITTFKSQDGFWVRRESDVIVEIKNVSGGRE